MKAFCFYTFSVLFLCCSRQCSKIRAYKEPPFSFPLPLFLGRLPQKNVAACMPTTLAFLTKEKKKGEKRISSSCGIRETLRPREKGERKKTFPSRFTQRRRNEERKEKDLANRNWKKFF